MGGKRWLRYGLVGNFLTYGIGTGFILYMGWIIYDITENQSTHMDEELAKELFAASDAQLQESARKAKHNYLLRREEKLRKHEERVRARQEENRKAEFM